MTMRARFLPGLLSVVLLASAETITVRADPPRFAWSDFRRVESMAGSAEDAHIAAEMSFPQPLRIQRMDDVYRLPAFVITVAPEPRRTTVRRSVGTPPELLRHEQGHFDLVVLAARALARELGGMLAGSASELSKRVEGSVDEHTNRADRLSRRYDAETDHGRDAGAQARWLRVIADALRRGAVDDLAGEPL